MTEAKAIEIVKRFINSASSLPIAEMMGSEDFFEAKGYLEAIEKTKGLVEALQLITNMLSASKCKSNKCDGCNFEMTESFEEAKEALALWKKGK